MPIQFQMRSVKSQEGPDGAHSGSVEAQVGASQAQVGSIEGQVGPAEAQLGSIEVPWAYLWGVVPGGICRASPLPKQMGNHNKARVLPRSYLYMRFYTRAKNNNR